MLCLVLLGGSAFSGYRVAQFAWRSGYYYGFDSYTNDTIYEARLSKDFLDEAGFVYYAAKRAHITYENGEIFEKKNLMELLQKANEKQISDLAKELMQPSAVEASEYNYARSQGDRSGVISIYDGEGVERLEEIYGGHHISQFENNDRFIVNEDGSVVANYDYFYKMAVAQYGEGYDLSTYKAEYDGIKEYLSSLKSLEYLIIDNRTGKVYTNSKYNTAEKFSNAYSDTLWYVTSNNNFDTATVSSEFASLSVKTNMSAGIAYYDPASVATTVNGAILGSSSYLGQFFNSMRYGYVRYLNDSDRDYILGSINLFESKPCTVYMSFDYSKADGNDPFAGVYSGYLDSVNHLSQNTAMTVLALALAAVLVIWLIVIAGRDYHGAPVRLLWEDKIFSDVRLLLSGGCVVGLGYLAFLLAYIGLEKYRYIELCHIGFIACTVVTFAVLLDYIFSFIRLCKNGTLLKNTLLFLPIRLILKLNSKLRGNNSHLPDGIKKQFKVVVPIYFLLNIICCVFIAIDNPFFKVIGLFDLIIVNIVFFALLYSYAKSLDKIRDAVEEAHRGNFDVEIDSTSMPMSIANLANGITDMRVGMQRAINDAVQNQRTKTQLITNVSHDLKTPLTSIITYSDLIRRSNIEDETVRGYVDVLTDKSLRLKTLIEDLTEAAKASTGSIDFKIENVNLYELAQQAIGENEDTLERNQIDIRVTPTDLRPKVRADGQKTYRVFENIISNIAKYALPQTRAYVTVNATPEYGIVTFKNISREPLNISPEKLMERFVRGDASRSGEGSGLGLAIARDLCSLQGGSFDIGIDGDMFIATVSLPLAPSQKEDSEGELLE